MEAVTWLSAEIAQNGGIATRIEGRHDLRKQELLAAEYVRIHVSPAFPAAVSKLGAGCKTSVESAAGQAQAGEAFHPPSKPYRNGFGSVTIVADGEWGEV